MERTLQRDYYLSEDIFQRERERIFFREWFCAGREEEVANPGDYLVLDVAGESVLVVRTREGNLAAHYNVCRHRGSRLVPGAPFATAVGTGATDRPYYATAGITCYGIDPYLVELDEGRREVHGNDERISLENIEFGLRLHLGKLDEMR